MIHGVIVLDIANAAKPIEVARVKLNDTYVPHWTGWDAKTQRVVVTGKVGPRAPTVFSRIGPTAVALAFVGLFVALLLIPHRGSRVETP